jgi:hypothetical protein
MITTKEARQVCNHNVAALVRARLRIAGGKPRGRVIRTVGENGQVLHFSPKEKARLLNRVRWTLRDGPITLAELAVARAELPGFWAGKYGSLVPAPYATWGTTGIRRRDSRPWKAAKLLRTFGIRAGVRAQLRRLLDWWGPGSLVAMLQDVMTEAELPWTAGALGKAFEAGCSEEEALEEEGKFSW